MTTDIHFVKNNPFILNDYRYTSSNSLRLPTSASSIHIPSNFHRSQTFLQTDSPPVIQSASCSNIQKTVVNSNNFENSAQAPPIPHSVFRRFRLVSELELDSAAATPPPISTSTLKGQQSYNNPMHSSSISSITTAMTTAASESVGSGGSDWNYNRGRLEHSQSHGAISHLQQPLKLQVDEYNNNNNNNEEDGKNCKFKFTFLGI